MKKTRVYIIITVILLVLSGIGVGVLLNLQPKEKIEVPEETVVENKVELTEEQKLWKSNHDINKDYVGQIIIDSGLINVPFVQARSVYKDNGEPYVFYDESGNLVKDVDYYNGNDVYIWTNWKTGKYDYNDEGGSTFMDYRNELIDQNLIIYGHHFSVWNDETRSKAFTPLEKLLEEENYKGNEKLSLILEKEKRTYELWAVYEFNFNDGNDLENLQYWRTNYAFDDFSNVYDENYPERYIETVEAKRLYDTGVHLEKSDETLTLQTCISGYTGVKYEIIVFRLCDTEKWLIN